MLFLLENGCAEVHAFPLMLLQGTELEHQRDRWQFEEEQVGHFQLPLVIESSSFARTEWTAMKGVAGSLRRRRVGKMTGLSATPYH